MPYVANINAQFRLSGVLLGEYVFEQNPSDYKIVSPLQNYTTFKTIQGNDVYQKHFIDNELRELTWEIASKTLYTNLYQYSVRDVDGNIPISVFSDQTAAMFGGIQCKVIDVVGDPIPGNPDYIKIVMKIKPEAYFEKMYKMIP